MGSNSGRSYERVRLDYEEIKNKFKWICTIGPAQKKIPGSTCTMRITFKRTTSRIRDFDNQRLQFEKYIHDFYAERNTKAATVWEKDIALVAVF